MSNYYYINDKLITYSHLSHHDRGFRFGDGVFESISVINYIPYLLEYHISRLKLGLDTLMIKVDIIQIQQRLIKLIHHNNHKQGLARIIISRGVGSIGYLPYNCSKPTIIIETAEKFNTPNHPIDICLSSFEKASPKSIPTGIKSLQGLNSTLAKIEAHNKKKFDGLLLNNKREVCEVSSANIFWIKDSKIYTPSVECGLIDGIIRKRIIEIFPVIKGKFKLEEILSADEVFITNISLIVLSVDKINDTKFSNTKYSQEIHNKILQDRLLYCA